MGPWDELQDADTITKLHQTLLQPPLAEYPKIFFSAQIKERPAEKYATQPETLMLLPPKNKWNQNWVLQPDINHFHATHEILP
jgi:hypothetical protein